jgi:hypothetical protein
LSKTKKIKAIDRFSNVPDGDLVSRATAIQAEMAGNSNFPNPPVDLATLKTAIEAFAALRAQSLDGSKKVIAQKNKQREVVIHMLRLLGRFVEVTSNGDMAIFQTSGFQAAAPKTPTPPLTEKIRKVEHGPNSGQLTVWLKSVAGASSYEIRTAVANATPAVWTSAPASTVKAPIVVGGLTPATTYLLQARALVKNAYTDWSDSVTFICT